MAGENIVKTITIKETGTDEVVRSFDRLAAAGAKASASTDRVAASTADNVRVFDRTAKAVGGTETQLNRLQRSLDVNFRNTERLAKAESTLGQGYAKGLIDLQRRNDLMDAARQKYSAASQITDHYAQSQLAVGKAALVANDNIRLTSNQMLNLGRQSGDIATMLAMGASPLQVLTSQAAQVVDALASGPGGVVGSLKAMGASIVSMITPARLLMAGFAGVAAAAIYFATRSDKGIKTAEDALKSYKALVDSLGDSYSQAGDAAERYFKRAQKDGPNVALAAIQGTTAEIRASLAQEIEGLYPKTQGFVASFASLTPEVLKGQDAIRKLGDELKSGDLTAAQFREQLALLRINPTTPPDIVKIADKLLASSINARDLANALGAVGEAAAAASGKMGRLKVPSMQDMVAPFGGAIPMLDRLNPDAMDAIRDGLKDQAAALTDATSKTNEYSDAIADQRASMKDTVAGLELDIALIGQSAGAAAACNHESADLETARKEAKP